ncbi:MAG: hypothetical protein ABSE51_03160 [Terracidiphilus sp.]|jgi:hypothetical protein
MRYHFDLSISQRLRDDPSRGIGFDEALEIFTHPYYLDQRSDVAGQYRAIGRVGERICSLVFEISEDEQCEFYHYIHPVTLWISSREEEELLPEAIESPQPPTADEIAELADSGVSVSRFFTNNGRTMPPILPRKEDALIESLRRQNLEQLCLDRKKQ